MLIWSARRRERPSTHINYSPADTDAYANGPSGTLNVTLDERALLNALKADPKATQEELASRIGKSVRTVKRLTVSLSEKGLLKRENGKRNGFWKVIKQ